MHRKKTVLDSDIGTAIVWRPFVVVREKPPGYVVRTRMISYNNKLSRAHLCRSTCRIKPSIAREGMMVVNVVRRVGSFHVIVYRDDCTGDIAFETNKIPILKHRSTYSCSVYRNITFNAGFSYVKFTTENLANPVANVTIILFMRIRKCTACIPA